MNNCLSIVLLGVLCSATALGTDMASPAPANFEKLDPWFGDKEPVQVTLTESREDPGKSPVVISIKQFTMRGDRGSICSQMVRPDLLPKDQEEGNAENIFFENGIAMEQSAGDKSWVKYKCTREQFLEYLTYWYTNAGMFMAFAQSAVQDKNNVLFTSASTDASVTFETRKGNQDLAPFRGVTVRKKAPLQMQEIVVSVEKPANYLLRFKFTYNAPDLGAYPKIPPVISKEIPNPLPSRMVYP